MKKYRPILFFLYLLYYTPVYAQSVWTQVSAAQKGGRAPNMKAYLAYSLDEEALKTRLSVTRASRTSGQTMELPLPDGSMRTFRVWESNVLPAELAAKYPSIKTFTAEAVDAPGVTAKIDFTDYGFHAMVFDGANTALIDPRDNVTGGEQTYLVRYKREETRLPEEKMQCLAPIHNGLVDVIEENTGTASRTISGYQLRTYRLALSANHQYSQKVTGSKTPTKAQVLSKMVTTINRVNGIYERELAVTMVFVPKEDTLIFTDSTSDPFGEWNDSAGAMLDVNQVYCDSFIGEANYDIGHVFSTGGGGLSTVSVVCLSKVKAKSVTGSKTPYGDGFDVDYVAHEIGHEFGADHTFNNNANGSCDRNAAQQFAFEPGSGSTIMAYAGICSPDDLQAHSDAYFLRASLQAIYKCITTTANTCPVRTATNNKPVSLPVFSQGFYIPYLTPFELEAPKAADSVTSSSITYCWEQSDLGDFGLSFKMTSAFGPLFRSFSPDTARLRVFPKMNKVLGAILDDSGNENAEGEKVPGVARALNFKLVVRNIFNGHGCYLVPNDSVHLDAINTGRGFTVTSQGTDGIFYLGGSEQTVTWDVAKTNLSPISASNVDIYLTVDSGRTWPYHLGNFPNNGSANVVLPKMPRPYEKTRIKVKGTGNVFFNVNRNDFAILNPDSVIDVSMFPNPAHNLLVIATGNNVNVQAVIFDAAGRKIWWNEIDGILKLDVTYWSRGIYVLKLIDGTSRTTIRRFVLD